MLFNALVLMLLTKFVPNSTTRRRYSSIHFLNFDAKLASNSMKFVPKRTKNMHNLHHSRKLIQIRCQKGADTKMHKCLVGSISNLLLLFCTPITYKGHHVIYYNICMMQIPSLLLNTLMLLLHFMTMLSVHANTFKLQKIYTPFVCQYSLVTLLKPVFQDRKCTV